jgi:non-ribosomal peptide synthetase component F
LAPLQLEYSDYAKWQRAHLRGLRLSKLIGYWTDQLAHAPAVLRLPTDHPRPKEQSFNGTVAGFMFDDPLAEALIALSRQQRVTLFMLLLTCYYALLYRYTGQEDLIVGAPVANRGHPELEPVIGIFVNTLILRVHLQESEAFSDLLKQVQTVSLGAFEHQALPFPKLIDELSAERIPGYSPLYQVVFNFQNASLIESSNPSAEGETMQLGQFPFVHSNTAKVDLNLTVTQNGSKISGGIEYNTDLFDRSTIDGMIAHYKIIAEAVVRDPSIPLMDIPLELGADERAQAAPLGDRSTLVEPGQFSFELE